MTDKRHDIDGLKGIAILAVVFYHLFDLLKSAHFTESTLFDGGFLGVDIFFVISGFLITSSVFYRLSNNDFSLLSFYKRRFLRIVPPLLFVCIFTLIIGYFLLFPEVYKELNIEVANALLFIGNFRFANSGGYFALDSSDKLLLHTWYLAVTIQFYILFPLIVLLLKKVFSLKRLPLAVIVVFILLTVTSVIVSRNGKGYLLTQCRIFELFFGSVLFFYKDIVYKRVFSLNTYLPLLGEVLGIVIIIASIFTVELQNGVWTVTTSLPTMIGTALVILSHNKNSVLRLPPLTLLGRCSYSLYLWHWPLFVFALRCGYTDTVLSCSIVILVILIFTALSYIFTEKRKIDYKVTVTLFLLCFASYFYFHHNEGDNYLSKFVIPNIDEPTLDENYKPSVVFSENNLPLFRLGHQNNPPHIFMIGDSNAGHYFYYLKNISKVPLYYFAESGVMAYGTIFSKIKQSSFLDHSYITAYNTVYLKTLNLLKSGDKVILCNRWDVQYDNYLASKKLKDSNEVYKQYLQDVIKDLDEQISLHKELHFYIVGVAINPLKSKISGSKLDLKNSLLKNLLNDFDNESTVDSNKKLNLITNSALKQYANKKINVTFIDRNIPIDNTDGTYNLKYQGYPIFSDTKHYTDAGSIIVGKYIMNQVLKDNVKDKVYR